MNMTADVGKKRWSKKSALAAEPDWSHFQQAIFDWVEFGDGNLRVGAVAGSGKSTVLSAIVARLPVSAKVHILAFNKHIAQSMSAKVPGRVGTSTTHSMGFALLSRAFSGAPCMDDNKYRNIIKELIKPYTPNQIKGSELKVWKSERIRFLGRLVDGVHSTLCTANPDRLKALTEYFSITIPPGGEDLFPLVSKILAKGEAIASDQYTISFGEMLYLPHVWNLQPADKDWLLVDEVQDANNAQLSLYQKMATNGRAILVGDADQAIQGFAFASPAMWDRVKTKFDATDLPLSVCYRCPSSHIDLARYFVPQIEARPNAPIGTVDVIHPNVMSDYITAGDLVLCRFTAPLIKQCLRLITQGIPATVRGRDIGVALAAIADIGEDCWGDGYVGELKKTISPRIEKAVNNNDRPTVDKLMDEIRCIIDIYRHFGKDCHNLGQFIEGIKALFSDESSPVTLSTIHRAKGDEADRVFLLGCNALPYTKEGMQGWQLKQEENLAYVALTRAKQDLFFVPIGRDRGETDQLYELPYGGMAVAPVKLANDKPDYLYPVGTRFKWLGQSGYEITGSIFVQERWEYTAKFTGKGCAHWAFDSYAHDLIAIE